MASKSYTLEKIISMLREAEVQLARGSRSSIYAEAWGSASRRTTAGASSMAA